MRSAMTPTPASEVSTEAATTMVIIRPIDRAASTPQRSDPDGADDQRDDQHVAREMYSRSDNLDAAGSSCRGRGTMSAAHAASGSYR